MALLNLLSKCAVWVQGSYDVLAAAYFVLLKMPVEMTVFFPMAALIGALIGLGSLANSSELGGDASSWNVQVSYCRLPCLKPRYLWCIAVMLLAEFVAPVTDKDGIFYARFGA